MSRSIYYLTLDNMSSAVLYPVNCMCACDDEKSGVTQRGGEFPPPPIPKHGSAQAISPRRDWGFPTRIKTTNSIYK